MVMVVYHDWWIPQQPESQISRSLIYSCVKGPVRTATLREHIFHDVCQATGDALLTHAHSKAITHTHAEYQTIASNSSKGG